MGLWRLLDQRTGRFKESQRKNRNIQSRGRGGWGRSQSAKLKEKEIFKLGLYWNEEEDYRDKDEKVLEGLQPHPNLESLTIEWHGGKKFPALRILKLLFIGSWQAQMYFCNSHHCNGKTHFLYFLLSSFLLFQEPQDKVNALG